MIPIAAMSGQPWFSDWNYAVLKWLFGLVPHHSRTDTFFQFLAANHLVSTWVFAAAFYWFWQCQHENKQLRRAQLLQIVIAFAIAVFITLVIRPWIAWPAPVLNPRFQALYPQYLWGLGSYDCFPSHSTLADFIVAAGIWRLNRRVSVVLCLWVLMGISLPRIFVGGHYPVDVIASIALDLIVLGTVTTWNPPESWQQWLTQDGPGQSLREVLLILWVFELGEDFRGISSIAFQLKRLAGF